ncbi:MAG: hypothetical protein M3R41_08850 [Pseudomonadota bacterium]|nr:hypothetical protein [Pseudomonadota bacterium]
MPTMPTKLAFAFTSLWLLPGAALAADACEQRANFMERAICDRPAVRARDEVMTTLYRSALRTRGAIVARMRQRRWLDMALGCRNMECLTSRYDQRIGDLMRGDAGRGLVRHYISVSPDTSGDLYVFLHDGWLTYDATQTVVGPRGEAQGDVDAASLGGTARLVGPIAREAKPSPVGCTAILQHNRDGSWSMGTRHCFDGAGADLNVRFAPRR